jgi:hypothetical protein
MTNLMASAQPAQAAAVIAAVGFMGIAAFQAALALGAPLGRAAWGGAHMRLPTGLRIASALATVFWVLATPGRPGTGRVRGLAAPSRRRPVGHVGLGSAPPHRRDHELRVIESVGALPVGTGGAAPGRTVPRPRPNTL